MGDLVTKFVPKFSQEPELRISRIKEVIRWQETQDKGELHQSCSTKGEPQVVEQDESFTSLGNALGPLRRVLKMHLQVEASWVLIPALRGLQWQLLCGGRGWGLQRQCVSWWVRQHPLPTSSLKGN